MKKLISILLCLCMLCSCAAENSMGADSDSTDAEFTAMEDVAKSLLQTATDGHIVYSIWESPQEMDSRNFNVFYSCVFPHSGSVSAEEYEENILKYFDIDTEHLRNSYEYESDRGIYNVPSYSSDNSRTQICSVTRDVDTMQIEYYILHDYRPTIIRMLTVKKSGENWQYVSNTVPEIDVPADMAPLVDFDKAKLEDIASLLAEHLCEYVINSDITREDVGDFAVARFIAGCWAFGEDCHQPNPLHPYFNTVKYEPGKIICSLADAKMIAYQIFGMENWFYHCDDFDVMDYEYVISSEQGLGLGWNATNISSRYIDNKTIKSDLTLRSMYENDDVISASVYFDVVTENDCTFLRFSEINVK